MTTKTNFTSDILIGNIKGGGYVHLAAPSWDCDWYWGFGYIQNKNINTHFDSLGNNNMYDNIKDNFTDFIIQDDKDLWQFCELMQTFYNLKNTAEVLGRGGSHYTKNPLSELIKNTDEVERINNILMPAIFDEIYALLKKSTEKKYKKTFNN